VLHTPLRQTLTFPPFLALLLALGLGISRIPILPVLYKVLERLGQTLVPLALFAVGFQLKLSWNTLRRYLRLLSLSLVYKLFLCPALFWFLTLLLNIEMDLLHRVMILEAAMATMITSAVIVSEFSLDEELAHLMVGVSILLSLFTVPFWDQLIMSI
jgi:predicted permease